MIKKFAFVLMQYMNTLTYLSSDAFSSIPSELVPDLQRMLSQNESFRPNAMDFTGEFSFANQFIFSLLQWKTKKRPDTKYLKSFLREFLVNEILMCSLMNFWILVWGGRS